VRVNNHQIRFISTHRKIGHSPSIKWYQLSRLIGEFYRVLSFSLSVVHHPIVHQKSKKNQIKTMSSQPFSPAPSFDKCWG
jgi:hypothetical protein